MAPAYDVMSFMTCRRLLIWLSAIALGACGAAIAWKPQILQIPFINRPQATVVDRVAVREVHRFLSGGVVESMACGTDGELLATVIYDLDLGSAPGLKVRSELWRVKASGGAAQFAQVAGVAVMVLRILPDGGIVASALSEDPDHHGVVRIDATGKVQPLARLPRTAFPNGIGRDDAGRLYVADSNSGEIWRVGGETAEPERWFAGEETRRRPYITIVPGANGVQFLSGAILVANSDRGTVVSLPIAADGRSGAPTVLIKDVPTDDFAALDDGTLLLTTHPFNTVVRARPGYPPAIIADDASGIAGPTQVVACKWSGGRSRAFVSTDGGLYGGKGRVTDGRPGIFELTLPTGG